MIRRYTYLDSYSPDNLPNDIKDVNAEYMRDHVDHCITTIRLALMCTSDLTPILLERDVENVISVIPDLQTNHKCRDFGKVQEWFIEHSYTDFDCIKKGAVGCDIIPPKYKRPVESNSSR